MSRDIGRRQTVGRRVASNTGKVQNEEQKPNLRGFEVYVGTFVGPGDPGNLPPQTSPSSPPWQNGFTYDATYPLWFAHGLDGETDMGGAYDLISGSPVSGTVAFNMPAEWRAGMAIYAPFVTLLEDPGDPEDRIYCMAAQVFDPSTGDVRVYWPLVATPYP